MPIFYDEDIDTPDVERIHCNHGNNYPYGKTEKCAECGRIYREDIMEWVREVDNG